MGFFAQKIKRSTSAAFVALLLFGITTTSLAPSKIALAAGGQISVVANMTGTVGQPVAIPDLQIYDIPNVPLMINVYASSGEFNFADTSATFAGTENNVTLTGMRDEINASLGSMTYTGYASGTTTVKLSLGSNVPNIYINPDNGHGYSIVKDELTWADARNAAEELYYGGVQGYLATITNQDENDFIEQNLQDDGWIGASDAADEGDWFWVTGPEAGTHFWTGQGNTGSVELGPDDAPYYQNWAGHDGMPGAGEPNNSSNEDCAQFYAEEGEENSQNGEWNDLECNNELLESYVVEFGDQDPISPIDSTFSINLVPRTTTISDCEELQALTVDYKDDNIVLGADIDCEGFDFEPIMLYDGNENFGFSGVFDGAGYTIKNITSSNMADYSGLFSGAYGAEFKNLTLDNVSITSQGQGTVGALIGYAENVVITNVYIKNVHISNDSGAVGGLIGHLELHSDTESNYSHIQNVSVDGGDVYGGEGNAGGLIGYVYTGKSEEDEVLIEKVYTNVTVEAYGNNAGGVVGYLDQRGYSEASSSIITVRDTYSWSEIYAPNDDNAGGVVGHMSATSSGGLSIIKLQRVYSNGDITGYDEVGGLVGEICDSGDNVEYIIENSFSASKISANSTEEPLLGALIGNQIDGAGIGVSLQISNLYYDQTRANVQTAGPIDGLDDIVHAINIDDSQQNYFIDNTSSAPLNTWNFDGIWVANKSLMPTFKPIVDFDNDSLSDDEEAGAPNNGDGNNDGLSDSQQANVASLVSSVSSKYVTLEVDASCDLSDISIADEASHADQDGNYDYSTGFVTFTASGCNDDQTQAKLFYHDTQLNEQAVRKYNPNTNTYFTIQGATLGSLTSPLSGTQVSYTVVDNGELDINDQDGVITDPVGLASILGSQAADTPDTGFQNTQNLLRVTAAFTIGAGLLIAISMKNRRQKKVG